MDRSVPPATTVPVGGSEGPLLRLVALVAVLLLVAIVKPWPGGSAGATAAAPSASPASSEEETPARPAGALAPDPSAEPTLPPDAVPCVAPDGWRLVTLGTWFGRPVRTWLAVDVITSAVGPTDPRIGFVRAGQAPLQGLGTCRPVQTVGTVEGRTDRAPSLLVRAWRLTAGSGEPVALGLAPTGPRAPSSSAAQLYGLDGSPGWGSPTPAPWEPGRYVVQVEAADLRTTAWIGLTLLAASASPAP